MSYSTYFKVKMFKMAIKVDLCPVHILIITTWSCITRLFGQNVVFQKTIQSNLLMRALLFSDHSLDGNTPIPPMHFSMQKTLQEDRSPDATNDHWFHCHSDTDPPKIWPHNRDEGQHGHSFPVINRRTPIVYPWRD